MHSHGLQIGRPNNVLGSKKIKEHKITKTNMKSTETLQRETKMFRNILKTNKHVQETLQIQSKKNVQSICDITKKNKNAHMYYKDKHK